MAITFDFTGELEDQRKELDRLIEYVKDNYGHGTVSVNIARKNSYDEWNEDKRISIPYSGGQNVFAYRKRSRRWGHYLNFINGSIQTVTIPEKRKTDEEIWEDSWKKALGYLEQSKLFPKYADNIRIALEIGYEGMKKADSLYWKKWDDGIDRTVEELKKIHEGLVSLTTEGKEYPNTELIWRTCDKAKIKAIYFGKRNTDKVRKELKQAMDEGIAYSYSEQVINYYDVSVTFNPETMTGSYSEEYRNCGNGHYYLLIDHEHALFYEDD